MAGKFGIGARVRDDDGDEGTVVDKRKGERLVKYHLGHLTDGLEMWWFKDDLTVAQEEAATPAYASAEKVDVAFKVGDRVRLTAVNVQEEWGRMGEAGTVVIIDEHSLLHVAFDNSGIWCVNCDILEHIQQLTIEAGKFYRTRDGRKVGPMVYFGWGDGFCWCDDERIGGYYNDFGAVQAPDRSPHEDIVAEWVEPVAVEPAPPNFHIGSAVTLTGTVTGINNNNCSVVLDALPHRASLDFPATELRAA